MNQIDQETIEKVTRLEAFRNLIDQYNKGTPRRYGRAVRYEGEGRPEVRARINKEVHWVRQQVVEAGCFQTVTIGPPPIVGGLIARDVDTFGSMFDPPYGSNLFPMIIDMVDRTIGVITTRNAEPVKRAPDVIVDMRKNFAFVAMSIDAERAELADVLDAIKGAADKCGVQAERIDEDRSNERITDRILESIRVAEHVIVDLTDERPNVFFEAGFAHGQGKIPIYIAKAGTKLHFDLKDYPVIFFKNLKQLKDELEARIRAIAAKRSAGK